MNPLGLNKLVVGLLKLAIPDIHIFSAAHAGVRESPYLLIESEALNERAAGKGTWEFELRVTLRANAHDWGQSEFDALFTKIHEGSVARIAADVLNAQTDTMHVYSAKLQSIAPLEAAEDDFIQTINFRLLIQI